MAVLVVGMERSGTSALTGTLNRLGLALPGALIATDKSNARGFFENRWVLEFNDRMLERLGSYLDDPLPTSRDQLLSSTARSAARELTQLFRQECGDLPAVVIKDPRLCRLLPIWIEALGQANRRIAAVLPLRHPLEVAASLQSREGLSEAHALSLWLQHVLAAERESRGLPRCFTFFDDLLRDWRTLVRTIGGALRFDWPRDPEQVANEIDAFLSPELRHHQSAPEDLKGGGALHELSSRAWSALCSPVVGASEQAVLDEVARELDSAFGVLSPLIGALDRDLVELRRQAEGLDAERARREYLEELAEAAIARHQDLESRFRSEEARFRSEVERHDLARRNAEKELEVLRASTLWRATEPLRSFAKRLPPPLRRALRGAAKLSWWTLSLRLRGKLAERRRNLAQAQNPAAGAAKAEEAGERPGDLTEATPIALPYRGFLERVEAATIQKATERLKRFPLFSAEDYAGFNGDVRDGRLDPWAHFLCFGAFEDRRWVTEDRVARGVGEYLSGGERVASLMKEGASGSKDESKIAALAARSPPIGIYVSSQGNVFMNEIAEDVAVDLKSLGVTVSLRDEMSAIEDRPPISIFVAVHEFFQLSRGREWIREDVVANSFMFQVEQAQTQWYRLTLPILFLARGVIDFAFEDADLLGRTGLPTLHFTPGLRSDPPALFSEDCLHPLFQVLPAVAKAKPDPESPFAERPLDIAFFGNLTPQRSKFFARHAAFLSDYETYIHCSMDTGPYTADRSAAIRLARHVLGHAKIALNVHRDEFPYFEWHRIVRLGMSSGSVVVSEPCLPHPDFKPGVHYFEENARHMPDLLEWLLRTDEGRREAGRVRANVQALILDGTRSRQNAARLLEFLLEHGAG